MSEIISLKKEIDKLEAQDKRKRDSGLGKNDWRVMKDLDSGFNSWVSGASKEDLEQGLKDYEEKLARNRADLEYNHSHAPFNQFNPEGVTLAETEEILTRRIASIKKHLAQKI